MWRQVDICERGMMMAIPHTTSSLSSSSSSSSSTSLQGSKAVKDEIINYDAHKITPEMRARVAKLMDSKGNSFEAAVRGGGRSESGGGRGCVRGAGGHKHDGSRCGAAIPPVPEGVTPQLPPLPLPPSQVIQRVSVAAAPLAIWVKANLAYSMVLERVSPLEDELNALMANIDNSSVLIAQYEQELKKCDEQVRGTG